MASKRLHQRRTRTVTPLQSAPPDLAARPSGAAGRGRENRGGRVADLPDAHHHDLAGWVEGLLLGRSDLVAGPGRRVLAVVDEVLAAFPQARIVDLPLGLPEWWDLADPVPEGIDVVAIEAAARKAAPRPPRAPMLPAASIAATSPATTESPLVEIAKELSGRRPDLAKIAGIVCEQLLARGSFYRPISDPSFRSALFFDRRTKSLESIQADSFKQTVSDRFGINRAATCWKHLWAAIENLSIGPNSTPAEPEAFWAGRPGAVYLSNGPGAIV